MEEKYSELKRMLRRTSMTFLLGMSFMMGASAQSVDALLDEADSLYNAQQYDAARTIALQALPLATTEKVNSEAEGDLLNLLSMIGVRQGNFDEAVRYAKQCNALDLKSGDADLISSSYNTLAGIYMSMRQPQEAEKYILKAISYAEKADNPKRMAVLLGMASEVYHNLKDHEHSLDYATRSYALEKQLNRQDKMAIRQAERAMALIALKRHQEAREALAEAIPGLRQSGNRHSLGIACNQMGQLMHQQHNDSAAVRYYNEALSIFLDQKDIYNESHTRKGLYDALRTSDPALAMTHNDRYLELRDSLYDEKTGELLSKYAAEYDNDVLQAENAEMHQTHRLYIVIGVVVVTTLLLLLAISALISHRDRRRIQQLIGEISTLRDEMAHETVMEPVEPVATAESPTASVPTDTADIAADREFILQVIDTVNRNLPTGQYGVEQIASEMNMGVQTFRRRVMAVTGRSPKTYISAIQMELASKLLLLHPDIPVQDIARRCGYDEATSFARVFRKTYGQPPTEYREANLKKW